MAIYGEFSHETLWFSIAMLVYQRVTCINHPIIGGTQFWPKAMSEANLQHLCGIGDVPHPGWSCRQLLNQPRSRRKRQHGDGKWGAWSCSCCLPFWDVVCVLVNVCFFLFCGDATFEIVSFEALWVKGNWNWSEAPKPCSTSKERCSKAASPPSSATPSPPASQ